MNTWLRSVLAVVALSVPLVGCGAQTGARGSDQQSQAATGEGKHQAFAKGTAVAVDAKFSRWLVTPRGEVAGILLEDGALVMIPPHATKDLKTSSLTKGDAVHVEGFTHEGSSVYAFASVKKGDDVVVAAPKRPEGSGKGEGRKHDGEGRDHDGKGGQSVEGLADVSASGKVLAVIPGRHGGARGYVLEDGTVAYLRHAKREKGSGEAKAQDLGVKKGDAISVSGKGGKYDLGTALVVKKLTLANGETKDF